MRFKLMPTHKSSADPDPNPSCPIPRTLQGHVDNRAQSWTPIGPWEK